MPFTYMNPQDEESENSNVGGEELPNLTRSCGATYIWWLLRKTESLELGSGCPWLVACGWLPVTQQTTSHTYAYGKHKLELVVNIVKRREIGREACGKHSCNNTESNLRLWWETHITFWETSERVSREPKSVTSTAWSYKRNQILFPHPLVSAYTPPYRRRHVLCRSSCVCAHIWTICSH